jgi:hypothetical protein
MTDADGVAHVAPPIGFADEGAFLDRAIERCHAEMWQLAREMERALPNYPDKLRDWNLRLLSRYEFLLSARSARVGFDSPTLSTLKD